MSVPDASPSAVPARAVAVGLRFELFVNDVAASVHFYEEMLGLRAPDGWDSEGYVQLREGALSIGVQHHSRLPVTHYFNPDQLAGARGVGVEIVIEVDEVDCAFARAQDSADRSGGRVEPISDRPWGQRDFRLIDPDGYYLRVTSHE